MYALFKMILLSTKCWLQTHISTDFCVRRVGQSTWPWLDPNKQWIVTETNTLYFVLSMFTRLLHFCDFQISSKLGLIKYHQSQKQPNNTFTSTNNINLSLLLLLSYLKTISHSCWLLRLQKNSNLRHKGDIRSS